jgi:hypothetical protein
MAMPLGRAWEKTRSRPSSGYQSSTEALIVEIKRVYGELLQAYGKRSFEMLT